MTHKDYKRLTLGEMQKRRWCTTRVVETGAMVIPAGVIVTIVDKHGGLTIRGSECPHCKVRIYARKVQPDALTEVHGE